MSFFLTLSDEFLKNRVLSSEFVDQSQVVTTVNTQAVVCLLSQFSRTKIRNLPHLSVQSQSVFAVTRCLRDR